MSANYGIVSRLAMQNIADAIRTKAGLSSSTKMTPSQMPGYISAIQTGYEGGNICGNVTGSIYGNVYGVTHESSCGYTTYERAINGDVHGIYGTVYTPTDFDPDYGGLYPTHAAIQGDITAPCDVLWPPENYESIRGNVSGYIVGSVYAGSGTAITGNVTGSINGYVYGSVGGGIDGRYRGYAVYGDVEGSWTTICGNVWCEYGVAITGNVTGCGNAIGGNVNGNIGGQVYGSIAGFNQLGNGICIFTSNGTRYSGFCWGSPY